ncbi:hypothetical protein FHS16_004351 [Paenibacillus endophyticus]|uniref:Uncharacterized protein n=1 Tax=Paenibacillus endophyticus TaxID=1294268 RepID=A0A7W5GBE0_9BACL|nr:hypothetical protein [Paenibacillus endophyticus]MBB3154269.1 hypothetical protein [Paenibacillus endophyticus]
MKRLFLIAIMIMLTSCGAHHGEGGQVNKIDAELAHKLAEPKLHHKDELFEMTLNIEKTAFAKGEPIDYSVSLTYIGDQDSITIWGPSTYLVFYLTDGKRIEMEGANTTELQPTVLKRGEKHHFPFHKSGGYSQDDPDASFWKTFYGEKELLLPSGTYLIAANTDFSLDEKVVDSYYRGFVHATITVE